MLRGVPIKIVAGSYAVPSWAAVPSAIITPSVAIPNLRAPVWVIPDAVEGFAEKKNVAGTVEDEADRAPTKL